MTRRAPAGPRAGVGAGWTDARPRDDAEVPRRVPVDEWRRRRRLRRRASVALVVLVFLAGSAVAVFGRGGFLDRRTTADDLARAQEELLDRARRIRDLRAALDSLRDEGAALERIAREELNYVREGEVSFLLLEDEPFADDAGPPEQRPLPGR